MNTATMALGRDARRHQPGVRRSINALLLLGDSSGSCQNRLAEKHNYLYHFHVHIFLQWLLAAQIMSCIRGTTCRRRRSPHPSKAVYSFKTSCISPQMPQGVAPAKRLRYLHRQSAPAAPPAARPRHGSEARAHLHPRRAPQRVSLKPRRRRSGLHPATHRRLPMHT